MYIKALTLPPASTSSTPAPRWCVPPLATSGPHPLISLPPARLPLPQGCPRHVTHTKPTYVREGEEGSIAPVEEGAVDHLQGEGGVLQGEDRDGGTEGEAQAQHRRQDQRRHR